MNKKTDPHLSGICAGDFGLKAAFWSGKKGDPLVFRTIVGWVVVTNYLEAEKLPFVAVVLNDQNAPTLLSQSQFPEFAGYFPANSTVEQAQETIGRAGISIPLLSKGRALE